MKINKCYILVVLIFFVIIVYLDFNGINFGLSISFWSVVLSIGLTGALTLYISRYGYKKQYDNLLVQMNHNESINKDIIENNAQIVDMQNIINFSNTEIISRILFQFLILNNMNMK